MPATSGRAFALAALMFGVAAFSAQAAPELVKPSTADPRVKQYDEPNVVLRPPSSPPGGVPTLAVFLPGTGGRPATTPALFDVVAAQGYRVIGLEYDDEPAVQQACPKVPDPECAVKVREMRVWGTGPSTVLTNPPEEAIVPRLAALLRWLDKAHPDEHWGAYLTKDGQPLWSRIAISGQSQGAGMAALIAKKEKVARVICFSSPVDKIGGRTGTQLPAWLSMPSATPAALWYGGRNVKEPFNVDLVRSYPALGIPADHVAVFDLELPPNVKNPTDPMAYHTINIRDPRYADKWRFLFGKAAVYR